MRKPRDTLEVWRTCAAPGCTNTFPAVVKSWGGGTWNKRYCCVVPCQQSAYRARRRQRLKAAQPQLA